MLERTTIFYRGAGDFKEARNPYYNILIYYTTVKISTILTFFLPQSVFFDFFFTTNSVFNYWFKALISFGKTI